MSNQPKKQTNKHTFTKSKKQKTNQNQAKHKHKTCKQTNENTRLEKFEDENSNLK